MVIPIGINAASGKEITINANAQNLPSGLKVFLEDRQNNTFTQLDEANSNFKTTLTESLNGIGRFYLHTKASVLNTSEMTLKNISIYKSNASTLRIVGLSQGKSSFKMLNILGKQVLEKSFISSGVTDISLPKVSTGVYIVQIKNESGTLNKKITLE